MRKREHVAVKRYVVLLIVSFAAGSAALAGCLLRPIKNLNSKGTTIVCLGDSLTYGYGAERGDDYPAVLARMLGSPVVNAGASGDTTVKAARRLNSDVLAHDPYLVIIEFGANDFLEKIPKEATRAAMREMARRIQEHGAMVAVVDISAGMLFREYRAIAYALAINTGSIFVPDTLRGIITNPSLKSDFVHPNAGGYKIIAERVYRGIKPYLGKRRAPQK